VRFLLGGEISNIYKRHGKTRKVHNLLFAPDLDAVGRLQTRLERIGNIRWTVARFWGSDSPRPAGDRPGSRRTLPPDPGAYLDTLVCAVWLDVWV
jgi:hypothetical protein